MRANDFLDRTQDVIAFRAAFGGLGGCVGVALLGFAIFYDRSKGGAPALTEVRAPTGVNPLEEIAIKHIKAASFDTLIKFFCSEEDHWEMYSWVTYVQCSAHRTHRRMINLESFVSIAITIEQANFIKNILDLFCEKSQRKASLEHQLSLIPKEAEINIHYKPEVSEKLRAQNEAHALRRTEVSQQIMQITTEMREIEERWNRERPQIFRASELTSLPSVKA